MIQTADPIRRIAVPRPEDLLFFGDDAMAAAWHGAQARLEGLDVSVSQIDMEPFFAVARLLYEGLGSRSGVPPSTAS